MIALKIQDREVHGLKLREQNAKIDSNEAPTLL